MIQRIDIVLSLYCSQKALLLMNSNKKDLMTGKTDFLHYFNRLPEETVCLIWRFLRIQDMKMLNITHNSMICRPKQTVKVEHTNDT